MILGNINCSTDHRSPEYQGIDLKGSTYDINTLESLRYTESESPKSCSVAMAFPEVQGMKRIRQGPHEQITVLCQDDDQVSRLTKPERGEKLILIHDYAQNVRVQRTRRGPMDNTQL